MPWNHKLMEFAVNDFAEHLRLAAPQGKYELNPETPEKQRILIGRAAVEAFQLQDKASVLKYGAYAIQTNGSDLLIYGYDIQGTINGLYTFLEKHLGIRWFGPTDDFRIIPEQTNLDFPSISENGKPDFWTRCIEATITPGPIENAWGVRNRLFKEFREWDMDANHSFYRLYPGSLYAKSHPEYYSMNSNGRRVVPPEYTQICYSNPDVIEIARKAAESYFSGGVSKTCFSLTPDDNMTFCQCPLCKPLQPSRPDDINCFTDAHMEFVEKITDMIKDKFPDRKIAFSAYGACILPPLKKLRNSQHYYLDITPDFTQYADVEYRDKELKNISDWCKQAPGIVVGWHAYTSLRQIAPCYFPSLFSYTIKRLHKDFNAISILGDGDVGFWPFTGPQGWLLSRLLWNVDADTEEILNEYFTKLYGPAAADVRSLYDRLEASYLQGSRTGGKWLRNHGSLTPFDYYSAEDVLFVRNAWDKARKAANGDQAILRRIDYMSSRMEVPLKMMEVWDISLRLAAGKPIPSKYGDTDKALSYCVDVISTFEEQWQKVIRTDKYLGAFAIQDYRGPSFDYTAPNRKEWYATTSSNIIPLLVKHPDEKRDAQFCKDQLCKVQLGLAKKEYKLQNNLLDNPSFELGEGATPSGADWLGTGAKGWGFYSTTPDKFKYGRTSQGRIADGKFSGYVKGIGDCIMIATPSIDVSDGCRFFLAEAKCWKNSSKSQVYICVWWRNAKGQIMGPNRSASLEISETDTWTHRQIIAEAPEGAVSAMVNLMANNMDDSEARFDEVSFRKINLNAAWKHPEPAKLDLPIKESLIPETQEDIIGIPGHLLSATEPKTFKFNGKGTLFPTAIMPIGNDSKWVLNAELQPAGGSESKGVYVGLQFFDKDMHAIMPYNVNRIPGTVTTLEAPCTFTDKVLKVSSTNAWKANNAAQIAFGCSQDNSDLPNFRLMPQAGVASITENEIHLVNEAGVEYPAGAIIAEHMPGPTYRYVGTLNLTVPATGLNFSAEITPSYLWTGAAFMRFVICVKDPLIIKNLELKAVK